MSKSIKRKFEWILENVTRDTLEDVKLKSSEPFAINFYGVKTQW